MQFDAQDAYYREVYPHAKRSVITRDDERIGRMYTVVLDDEIRIIDIALLPAHRGQRIGSALVAQVAERAHARGLAVRLHVEPWNPAHRLYLRMGFTTVRPGEVYELMELPPPR